MEYVPRRLEEYAERFTTVHSDVFDRLRDETSALPNAGMSVGPLEGAFLSFMVFVKQPRRVLEIGTFTGWPSIAMASALPPGGALVPCDVNEETTEIARRYAEEAGAADRIDYRLGPALETIAGLEGELDLVFIDADKPNYVNYYEATLPRLTRDGLMVLDNTLWSGRVADPAEHDENVEAIRSVNKRVLDDPRVDNVLLTVRDGMNLVWLR